MATETLPELMKAVSASVQRAAEVPEGGVVDARDFEGLVRYCLFSYREARRVHRAAKATLRQGVEAGEFRRRCSSYLASVSDAAGAAVRVRGLAAHVRPDEANAGHFATLDRVEQGLAAIRAAFAGYLERMNEFRSRPIDRDLIERRAREAEAAGSYLRIERIEDLFGEPPHE